MNLLERAKATPSASMRVLKEAPSAARAETRTACRCFLVMGKQPLVARAIDEGTNKGQELWNAAKNKKAGSGETATQVRNQSQPESTRVNQSQLGQRLDTSAIQDDASRRISRALVQGSFARHMHEEQKRPCHVVAALPADSQRGKMTPTRPFRPRVSKCYSPPLTCSFHSVSR